MIFGLLAGLVGCEPSAQEKLAQQKLEAMKGAEKVFEESKLQMEAANKSLAEDRAKHEQMQKEIAEQNEVGANKK